MNERHILSSFDRDLESIQASVMKMGGLVEAALASAATALEARDVELAEKVRAGDTAVDVTSMCARAAGSVDGGLTGSATDQILLRTSLDDALDQLYNELTRLERTPEVDALVDATATYRGAARLAANGEAVDLSGPAADFGDAARAVGASC